MQDMYYSAMRETSPIDLAIGSRIRTRRKQLGKTLSQVALAFPEPVAYQSIHRWETGENRISAAQLWDLSRVLGVRTSYFFDGLLGD